MAILRAELKGKGITTQYKNASGSLSTRVHGIYEGIIEIVDDLALSKTADYDPGSILLCLANQKLYIKNSLGQWEEVIS